VKYREAIIGLVIGVLLIPVAYLLLLCAAFSHGPFNLYGLLAEFLFSVSFVIGSLLGLLLQLVHVKVHLQFMVFVSIQLPVYGWIIGSAWRYRANHLGLCILLGVHIVCYVVWMAIQHWPF